MRWAPMCALVLVAALPVAAQDGGGSGIEEDSRPTGPEEPEPKKPEPKPEEEAPENHERGDDFRPPTAAEINRAIDRGVEWLKKAQRGDGSWGPCTATGRYGDPSSRDRHDCYSIGPTAFSLFALGTCGVSRDDKVARAGIEWIAAKSRYGYEWTSYESSATILALTALNGTTAPPNPKALPRSSGGRPPKGAKFRFDDWNMMTTRVQGLLECIRPGGGFTYWDHGSGEVDTSATQFAILALRSASFAGYPVEKAKPDVWSRTAGFLEACQAKSGGFPYHKRDGPSRGMTAAGVSTLVICREQMAILKEKEPARLQDVIAKGLSYLDAKFDLETNPSPHFEGSSHYHYCYLYALERTGVLASRREFKGKDWYTRGAAWLLAEQRGDGSWSDGTCMDPEDTLGTCFALLFLKKATAPPVTRSGG